MRHFIPRALSGLLRYGGAALLGGLFGAIVIYLLWARSGPPLEPWHLVEFDEEFRAGDPIDTLADYLALEDRVFRELDAKVYSHAPEAGPGQALIRFMPGSLADPRQRTPNWNRTFELLPDGPARGGVLLLHGMSDGPYSLRALGQALQAQGWRVLGLRLPGHGTAPAGLRAVTWPDMTAATRLGLRHLQGALPGKPLHVIGYSTGGALAVEAALDGLDGDGPVLASLVLVSPAIGVTPAAGLTWWLEQLARLPGLERLAWTVVLPEFDPFNYNAFSANAVTQVHRLTGSINARVQALAAAGPLAGFPPTLVLLSTVDRTVSPDAVVDALLAHLPEGRGELLLYDINRLALKTSLLARDPTPFTDRLLARAGKPFTLTLVTNESPDSRAVVAHTEPPGAVAPTSSQTLGETWPVDAVSLSHVDLPFPPDDPLYGRCDRADGAICFGALALRGEAGVIAVPAQWLMRLRYNPFYEYQERRVVDWIAAASGQ